MVSCIKHLYFSTYIINCDSISAATLTQTLENYLAEEGPTNFTVTFDQSAGVIPGTTYECSVKMEIDGFTSAKSFPSIIITPDSAIGNIWMYMFYFILLFIDILVGICPPITN